jgi:wyosine [tRNA(Phe)-imidazoG37] synthetase (radical SAM superfamily)
MDMKEPRLDCASFVYGPVPSRRFGLSLGVDLVPHKICTYDCVYCQLGPTTCRQVERELFVDPDAVVEQVVAALGKGPRPDVITMAGSGEPTLYAGLGEVVAKLKGATAIPILLITNGSLLMRSDVAAEAALCDLVAPDVDAGDDRTFLAINRPHPSLNLEAVLGGIAAFAADHQARTMVEVFIARGVNDSPEAVAGILRAVERVGPGQIHLNTAVRPTPGRDVLAVDEAFLEQLAGRISAPAGVASCYRRSAPPGPGLAGGRDLAARVLRTLRCRPCTLDDLAASLAAQPEALAAAVADLEAAQTVRSELRGGKRYFVAG